MSSYKFNGWICAVLFSGAIVGLSGCGYAPLYGQSATGAQMVNQLASVQVKPIPDRIGQMLRTELQRGLSPKSNHNVPAYQLYITLSESIANFAVEQSAFATRSNLTLNAKYRLIRTSDMTEITTGSAHMVSSYNILSSHFATQSAEANSRTLAVVGLSETIRQRLAVYLRGPGGAQAPSAQ